jgi:two-component system, chemotaxis family, sensor kinase CheA
VADMDDMAEIVQEFLVESHENLDQLDRDLVALEQQPESRDLLSSVFRTIHTIKGTSGFLAFGQLEKVTHAGESLLARLRDGAQVLNSRSADALLRMADTVRSLLDEIEASGAEGATDVEDVIAQVSSCIEDGAAVPAPSPPEPTPEVAAEPVPVDVPEPLVVEVPAPQVPAQGPPPAPEVAPARATGEDGGDGPGKRGIADSSIRVDVDLLDRLMRLVGELVLTRNQLVLGVGTQANPALARTTQRLNLITSELQESVMKTRMQTIDHLWAKLPRIVRDLASACGKQVGLAMVGRDTELDRTLLEAVKDPLTHLVRNAVDHGIEPPAARLAVGKPSEGTLTLSAYHESGHVIVEVTDDGGGIDPDKVGRSALEKGLVTVDQLARMDRRELMNLLFRPGFSTAAKVTNVSGRGVGMDVVKTNIERIGGAVEVDSTLGVGTTWRLTIPLTLAIVQALTVQCGPERYAIPQVAVHELVFLDGQPGSRIEYVSGAPVYRLRGRLLPLVRLDRALGLEVAGDENGGYVAVLQAEGRRFGLVVDRVLNTEEIVVKPLSSRFKDVGVYAGATITGDGKVALILDVQSLARRQNLAVDDSESVAGGQSLGRRATGDQLLVVAVGERRIAIPLDMVTRLEEFSADRVERVGSREVVQYREQILPLVRLSYLLGVPTEVDETAIPVVVYTENGRSVALAVERVVDIVEDSIDSRSDVNDDCLLGSAVIQDKVTELLDARRAILAADPMFYDGEPAPEPFVAA